MSKNELWVEKYRPNNLNDYIITDQTRDMLQGFIDKKTICNLLLCGKQGIGKTTLAKLLVNELDATMLYINASIDNGIDVIREKIIDFCESVAMDGNIKIVILDEMGGTSPAFQAALRNLVESSSDDTRFILTANYINKIIDPIKSRCTPINLQFDVNMVLKRCIHILKQENIKFDKETLTIFSKEVIKTKWPDIRSIINILEQWSVTGTLKADMVGDNTELEKIINFIIKEKNVRKIREYLIKNEDKFGNDYPNLTSLLFNKMFEIKDTEKVQLLLAEGLYQMNMCLDSEVIFYATLMKIKAI